MGELYGEAFGKLMVFKGALSGAFLPLRAEPDRSLFLFPPQQKWLK